MDPLSQKFSEAFEVNIWGNSFSRSGPGSTLDQTRVILAELPSLLRRFQIKTMLDIPCGDFFWMKEIRQELELILSYMGGDIVPELIAQNRERYQTPKISFKVLNLVHDDLPKVDLILTRDCLIHLSFQCIADGLLNAQRSGSIYLLASTYTKPRPNVDIEGEVSLSGRAINLCAHPFSFPEPVLLINEGCTEQEGQYNDKSLGLWRLQDLHLSKLHSRIRTRAVWEKRKRQAQRVARDPRRIVSAIIRRLR